MIADAPGLSLELAAGGGRVGDVEVTTPQSTACYPREKPLGPTMRARSWAMSSSIMVAWRSCSSARIRSHDRPLRQRGYLPRASGARPDRPQSRLRRALRVLDPRRHVSGQRRGRYLDGGSGPPHQAHVATRECPPSDVCLTLAVDFPAKVDFVVTMPPSG